MCRICWQEEISSKGSAQKSQENVNKNNDEPNPLISVCKCSGSVKLVHLYCLRSWLDSKKETRVTDSTSSY
jgi:E3 ubiquitin-protein ligase DOA10